MMARSVRDRWSDRRPLESSSQLKTTVKVKAAHWIPKIREFSTHSTKFLSEMFKTTPTFHLAAKNIFMLLEPYTPKSD